jgi:branched-chain amino acid transport system ATP-binding protein
MTPQPASLSTENLFLRFGGLLATNDVNFEVRPGDLHAIIGPNGAGKTTLISLLAGDRKPTSGTIRLNGEDITAVPPYERAKKGFGRSFQITSIFREFTTLQNVMLAIRAREGRNFRFFKSIADDPAVVEPAREILQRLGLAERMNVRASELAHGEKRSLELAIALATRPSLLLLDEPTAGMGPDEASHIVNFLRTRKGSVTMVLIEHDMDAVFSLADRISVLVYGKIIATGTPPEIRNNADVRRAYLGDDEA